MTSYLYTASPGYAMRPKRTEQHFSPVKVNERFLSYQDSKKYGLQKKMDSP